MDFDQFNEYCLSKPGVEVSYPFKGEAAWMKVMGKMFAMANVLSLKMDEKMVDPFHFINVKCDPDKAINLREKFGAVIPAWHQSKVHWNTLLMDGSLSDQFILDQIDHSYNLVVSSLSKKLQQELNQMK